MSFGRNSLYNNLSYLKNILSAVFIFGFFSTMFSQSTYCPEKMLLLQKYKSKSYENARGYIDTVLSQCPDQNQDPYFWHVCGFINLDIFKFVENKEVGDRKSVSPLASFSITRPPWGAMSPHHGEQKCQTSSPRCT